MAAFLINPPHDEVRAKRIAKRIMPQVRKSFGDSWTAQQVWLLVRSEAKKRKTNPKMVAEEVLFGLICDRGTTEVEVARAEALRLLSQIQG